MRANGIAYQGINVLMLWSESVVKGYSAPIWMTFRQAHELNAHIRKGEHGSTVVYASKFTRTGTDAAHAQPSGAHPRESPSSRPAAAWSV